MTTPCIYRSGCPDPYACQANRSCLQLKKCAIAACPHEKVESSSYCIYHETPADRERKKAQASNLQSLRDRVAALDTCEPGGRGWALPGAAALRDAVLDMIDDMLPVETSALPVQRICVAYEQGVGQRGRNLSNPYAAGTPEHQAWGEGFHGAASPAETTVAAAHREGREPMSRIVGDLDWCLAQINSAHPVHSVLKRVADQLVATGETAAPTRGGCWFGSDVYGWCELDDGHDGPHEIKRKAAQKAGAPTHD